VQERLAKAKELGAEPGVSGEGRKRTIPANHPANHPAKVGKKLETGGGGVPSKPSDCQICLGKIFASIKHTCRTPPGCTLAKCKLGFRIENSKGMDETRPTKEEALKVAWAVMKKRKQIKKSGI